MSEATPSVSAGVTAAPGKMPREAEEATAATDLFSSQSITEDTLWAKPLTVYPQHFQRNRHEQLHFKINPSEGYYLNLARARLNIRLKIVRGNHALGAQDRVCLPNLAPYALWRSVDMKINDGTANPGFSYRHMHLHNYLNCLMGFSRSCRRTHMLTRGWIQDDDVVSEATRVMVVGADGAAVVPATVNKDDSNMGYLTRVGMFAASREVEYSAPIGIDFTESCECLFSDAACIELIYEPQGSAAYYFMTDTPARAPYQLQVTAASLEIPRVKIPVTQLAANKRRFATTPYRYPFRRVEYQERLMTAANREWTFNLLEGKRMPNSILIAMVEQARVSPGNLEHNPLVFKHHGLENIVFEFGDAMERRTHTFDFTTNADPVAMLYTNEYQKLFDNLGVYTGNSSNFLNATLWKGNGFFIVNDLSPDGCGGSHYHQETSCTLSISLRLRAALAANVILYARLSYNEVLLQKKSGEIELEKVV